MPLLYWFTGGAHLFRGNSGKQIDFQNFSTNMLKKHDVDHIIAYKNGDLVTGRGLY
jgi:hypothetical protein